MEVRIKLSKESDELSDQELRHEVVMLIKAATGFGWDLVELSDDDYRPKPNLVAFPGVK
jgi:hypothetical protein